MTYNDIGEMPYYELMQMIEDFKPRLKEIAEAKQAGALNKVMGG